jgi:hypothetical protein
VTLLKIRFGPCPVCEEEVEETEWYPRTGLVLLPCGHNSRKNDLSGLRRYVDYEPGEEIPVAPPK